MNVDESDSDEIIEESTANDVPSAQSLPKIFDGKYFVVQKIDSEKITASCKLCGCMRNGSIKSSGNFLSHLKRKHTEIYTDCKEYIALKTLNSKDGKETQTLIGVQNSKTEV